MSSEHFIRIPAYIIEAGIIKMLTHNELKVFSCLNYHQSWRTGKSFPGWKLITQETGVGKNSVFKCLKRLKELGCISIEKDTRKRRYRHNNIYQIFRTLQDSLGTVTVKREQSPRKLNRDEKGRIVTVRGERTATVNRERIVTVGEDCNESIERDKGTRKSDIQIFTISKKTIKEIEAVWGKEKTEAYMQEHRYIVDSSEENASENG